MNKQEYIETLRHYLAPLPEDERNELLRDYEAHFIYGQQRGKTEQEIITELGDPTTIARETVGADFLPPPPWAPQRRDTPRLIAVSLLLFFLNIMLAIPIGASIWAVFVSFCAAALACLLAPLSLLLEKLLYDDFMISKLFYAIGTLGVGMLLLAVVRHLGTGLYTLTLKYLRWNVATWRGKS
jgi:uncharacterized membrane protein